MPESADLREAIIEAILRAMLEKWGIDPRSKDAVPKAALAYAQERADIYLSRVYVSNIEELARIKEQALLEDWTIHEYQEAAVDAFTIPSASAETYGVQYPVPRALMWARTELGYAHGAADVIGWRATGIRQVKILDPGSDEPCSHIHGKVVRLDDYAAHMKAHPNCNRTAVPVEREDEVPDGDLARFIDTWPTAA